MTIFPLLLPDSLVLWIMILSQSTCVAQPIDMEAYEPWNMYDFTSVITFGPLLGWIDSLPQ